MLTDEQVIELVRRTNPVPDLESLPDPRLDTRALLAASGKERKAMGAANLLQRSTSRRLPRIQLRPTLAFITAMILILAAIGVIAFLPNVKTDVAVEPSSLSPTTTAVTAATPETLPEETPDAASEMMNLNTGTWTGNELGFAPTNVSRTRVGFLAGGPGGLWISEEGNDWTQTLRLPLELLDPQPVDRPSEMGPAYLEYSIVNAVTEDESLLYAFGTVVENPTAADAVVGEFVWTSEDGQTWDQTRLATVPLGQSAITGAAAGGGQVLAYFDTYEQQDGCPSTSLILSENSSNWTSVSPEEAGLVHVTLSQVVFHNGTFVGLGRQTCTETTGALMLYTSPAGEHWEARAGSPFPDNAFPEYAVAVDDGVVYLGGLVFDGEQRAALWRSEDGVTFEKIELPSEVYNSWSIVYGIVPSPRGLLVVTWLGARDDPMQIMLAAEDDTATLQTAAVAADTFADSFPYGAAAFNDHIIVVGEKGGSPYLWRWVPAD